MHLHVAGLLHQNRAIIQRILNTQKQKSIMLNSNILNIDVL